MSDEDRPGVTREELPDEMPRSTTSDDTFRRAPWRTRRPSMLLWLILALAVAAIFALVLRMLGPPAKRIGQAPAEVVIPAAPPIRSP
jgi:hypothetical protein